MEVNKEEALRALGIAQKHRGASNYPSALKFAKKSVALYSTPEGEKLVQIIETEIIEVSGSSNGAANAGFASPPTPGTPGEDMGSAKATGVEGHDRSGLRDRHKKPAAAASSSGSSKGGDKQYTSKQVEVVARVKRCKHHQYYEILSLEKTCSDNDVKRAYKKLALALHPDKNSAPGADEAFKMVSKAFQILSDKDLRAAFDVNPSVDPTQRGGGGGGGGSGMRGFGGGMHPGFQDDLNPDDIFNMFFGGGGGPAFQTYGGHPFGGARVYTFGGGQGFHGRRARAQAEDETQSPLMAILPFLLLLLFLCFSLIPNMFSGPVTPDPGYSFKASERFDASRATWQHGINYHVNTQEWEASPIWQSVPENKRDRADAAMFSSKLRRFEHGVETRKIERLRNECHIFESNRQRRINEETGVFGWGADYNKIRKIRLEKNASCEQLRAWGLSLQGF